MIIKNIAKNRTFTNVVLNADYVVAGGAVQLPPPVKDFGLSLYRIVPYLEAMLPVKFAFGH